MVLKKLMVGCLIASMLVSGGGTVFATTVDSVNENQAQVMSEAGVPKTVNGDVVLNVTGATLTGSMIQEKLEVLTVYDSDGNALDYSVQLCRDGKYKEFTYDEGAEYINSLIETGLTTVSLSMYAEDDYHTFVIDQFIVNVVDEVVEEPAEEITGNITYSTHVQNVGWQDAVADGNMSGTEGKGLRLEGIKIESGIEGLGVSYSTHVENIGWQNAVTDGELSGTSGKGLRLEAIRIELTGNEAANYDVYYRVHAQNVGWMGWASNGAEAGTAGYGYRLEGIEIEIVEKGAAAPGSTEDSYRDATAYYLEAYSDVLEDYSLLAETDEYDASRMTHVHRYVGFSTLYAPDDIQVAYLLEDFSGDGIPELFIAHYDPSDTNSRPYNIVDMYDLIDGNPQRMLDGATSVNSWGERTYFHICENHVLRLKGSGGAEYTTIAYYRFVGTTQIPVLQAIHDGGNNYYVLYEDGTKINITKEQSYLYANNTISYSTVMNDSDINWILL